MRSLVLLLVLGFALVVSGQTTTVASTTAAATSTAAATTAAGTTAAATTAAATTAAATTAKATPAPTAAPTPAPPSATPGFTADAAGVIPQCSTYQSLSTPTKTASKYCTSYNSLSCCTELQAQIAYATSSTAGLSRGCDAWSQPCQEWLRNLRCGLACSSGFSAFTPAAGTSGAFRIPICADWVDKFYAACRNEKVCFPRSNGDCTLGGQGYANPSAAYGNGQTGVCWPVSQFPEVGDGPSNFINNFFGDQLVYYNPTTKDPNQQCWTPAWSPAASLVVPSFGLLALILVALL